MESRGSLIFKEVEKGHSTTMWLLSCGKRKLTTLRVCVRNCCKSTSTPFGFIGVSTRLSSTLPCDYQEIELDIQREGLQDLIQKCNKGLANAKKELVISHNDNKPKNILWHVNEPYLVDFDAVSKVNPTAAAYESAFTFAYEKGSVDVDKFKAYLKEYQKYYSFNQSDYLKYVSMNGKLRWLMFIYGKDWRRDLGLMQELDDLVFELEVFNKYISM